MKNTNKNVDFVYRNSRPSLTVEATGGAELGRCYHASYFQVTSSKPLSGEDFERLQDMGFLGYGQEFTVHQVVDGDKVPVPARINPGKYTVTYQEGDDAYPTAKEIPASGSDQVPCVMVDPSTGEVIPGVAINPYSGEPYAPHEVPFYVYRCESRVDSSD